MFINPKTRYQVPYSDEWLEWDEDMTSKTWTPYNIPYYVESLHSWVTCDPDSPKYMIVPHDDYVEGYSKTLKKIKES